MDGPAVRFSAPSTITKQPRAIVMPLLMFRAMDGEVVVEKTIRELIQSSV
jgi:hypothetical protein